MPRNLFLMAAFLIYRLVITGPLRPRPRVSSTGQSKSKSRTWNQSRQSKRPKTKSQSSTASTSENTQSSEAVTIAKNAEQSEMSNRRNESIQQADILREPGSYQTSDNVTSPDYSFQQSLQGDYPLTPFLPPIRALFVDSETRSYPAEQGDRLPKKV